MKILAKMKLSLSLHLILFLTNIKSNFKWSIILWEWCLKTLTKVKYQTILYLIFIKDWVAKLMVGLGFNQLNRLLSNTLESITSKSHQCFNLFLRFITIIPAKIMMIFCWLINWMTMMKTGTSIILDRLVIDLSKVY